MPDREKVINEIGELLNGYPVFIPEAAKRGLSDAIALLKEQEAVEPKKTAYQRVDHITAYRYRCGTCDMSIFPSYKYCPFCGQEVKWE